MILNVYKPISIRNVDTSLSNSSMATMKHWLSDWTDAGVVIETRVRWIDPKLVAREKPSILLADKVRGSLAFNPYIYTSSRARYHGSLSVTVTSEDFVVGIMRRVRSQLGVKKGWSRGGKFQDNRQCGGAQCFPRERRKGLKLLNVSPWR